MKASSVNSAFRCLSMAGGLHSTTGCRRACAKPHTISAKPISETTVYRPFQPISPSRAMPRVRQPSAKMRTECAPRNTTSPSTSIPILRPVARRRGAWRALWAVAHALAPRGALGHDAPDGPRRLRFLAMTSPPVIARSEATWRSSAAVRWGAAVGMDAPRLDCRVGFASSQ
jgi:hypothetical protein